MIGILNIIGALLTAINHAWTAYNNAPMVQAKVAQMSQDEKDRHNALVEQAMKGTADQRAKALEQLRDIAAE